MFSQSVKDKEWESLTRTIVLPTETNKRIVNCAVRKCGNVGVIAFSGYFYTGYVPVSGTTLIKDIPVKNYLGTGVVDCNGARFHLETNGNLIIREASANTYYELQILFEPN